MRGTARHDQPRFAEEPLNLFRCNTVLHWRPPLLRLPLPLQAEHACAGHEDAANLPEESLRIACLVQNAAQDRHLNNTVGMGKPYSSERVVSTCAGGRRSRRWSNISGAMSRA